MTEFSRAFGFSPPVLFSAPLARATPVNAVGMGNDGSAMMDGRGRCGRYAALGLS